MNVPEENASKAWDIRAQMTLYVKISRNGSRFLYLGATRLGDLGVVSNRSSMGDEAVSGRALYPFLVDLATRRRRKKRLIA